MYNRQAILFPLILAAMLALLTFWINQAVVKNSPKMDGSNRHDHDYMLNNFYTTKMDTLGNLHYGLAATEMKHYPDDDSTVLQRPRFTQYTINKPYAQIVGLRGYVSSGGEEIQIVDNVKVTKPAFEGTGETQIITDKLTIYPNDEMAKTDSPVTITQFPKTEIHAVGMVINKKEQSLTLGTTIGKSAVKPARVHAHYERPAKLTSPAQSKVNKKLTSATKPLPNKTTQSANASPQTKRVRRAYE